MSSSVEIYEEYLRGVAIQSRALRNRKGCGVFLDGIIGGREFYMGVMNVAFIEWEEQAGDRDEHKAVDTGGVAEEVGGSESDEEGGGSRKRKG